MSVEPVTRYDIDGGARIYRIQTRVFFNLTANIYVLIAGSYVALIDTGSGLGESDVHLSAGFEALRDDWGERVGWGDVRRIIVSHAHIDHYGGLTGVRRQTNAPVAVHELDRRVLTSHEERLVLTSRALGTFLRRAGVSDTSHTSLMGMYGWSKDLFRSVEVETILRDGDLLDDVLLVHHVPGHCPGQVCLQIGDVLLSADHVLPRTTPHLAPESIMPSTGLEHYLQALRKIAGVPGIRLALGGHEHPIDDLYERIEQIEQVHQQKLERVLDACAEPHTINELMRILYPHVEGYDILLALMLVGAYVEYLDQRGLLSIANLDEVAQDERVAPQYRQI